jgi:hypothetical protein
MYSYFFHVLDGENGYTRQVGYARLYYSFQIGDMVTGELLWSSYRNRISLHEVKRINGQNGEFTVILIPARTGNIEKKRNKMQIVQIRDRENSCLIFRPKSVKRSNDLAGEARLSRHRYGYAIAR